MREENGNPQSWLLPPIPKSHVLAIPIPPRELPVKRDKAAFLRNFVEKLRRTAKAESPGDAAVVRRRELAQSICLALILNLAIIGALLLVVIAPPGENDSILLRASIEDESESETEAADGNAGTMVAAAVTSDTQESASDLDRSSLQIFALSSTQSEMPMSEPNDSMMSFGQSLNMSDFAAIESASRREAREFVYGSGSHHAGGGGKGGGVSQAVLAGLFPKSKLGDGSGTAVFVDMSGSMQETSRAVDRYMDEHFKNDVTRHVLGCAMNGVDDLFSTPSHLSPEKISEKNIFSSAISRMGKRERGSGGLRSSWCRDRPLSVFTSSASMRCRVTI